jgi:hypothetical protein
MSDSPLSKLGPETIMAVDEVTGFKHDGDNTWDGFKVTTDKRVILLLVGDGQSCCEDWGMVASEDDVTSFMGAKLLRINWTNPALSKKLDVDAITVDEGQVMFVDFETSQGVLQLAVYNCHNGYYGHAAILVIDGDHKLEEYL